MGPIVGSSVLVDAVSGGMSLLDERRALLLPSSLLAVSLVALWPRLGFGGAGLTVLAVSVAEIEAAPEIPPKVAAAGGGGCTPCTGLSMDVRDEHCQWTGEGSGEAARLWS